MAQVAAIVYEESQMTKSPYGINVPYY